MKVAWSAESARSFEKIIDWIMVEWGEKPVQKFKTRVLKIVSLLQKHPELGEVYDINTRFRAILVTPQTYLVYTVIPDGILIIDLVETRQNPDLKTD